LLLFGLALKLLLSFFSCVVGGILSFTGVALVTFFSILLSALTTFFCLGAGGSFFTGSTGVETSAFGVSLNRLVFSFSTGILFLFGLEVAPVEEPTGTLFRSIGFVSSLGGLIACWSRI